MIGQKATAFCKINNQFASGELEVKQDFGNENKLEKAEVDNKYIISSIGKVEFERSVEEKWEGQPEAVFHTVTSDSFWSIGSVPDEYTVFHNNKAKAEDNTIYFTSNRKENESVAKPSIDFVINKDKEDETLVLYNKESEDELDTETDEQSHKVGEDNSSTLHIPSMVTHLKRKDNYLESLDAFLNENLKVIADLIFIK